jgi:5'-3' exoribonuclease 1
MLRGYLECEFSELKEVVLQDGQGFDLERIIDDVILICMLVGNDFIPNLPKLHINEEALSIVFTIYKTLLPIIGGYINENGRMHMGRMESFLHELAKMERGYFEMNERVDKSWERAKQKEERVRLESLFYDCTSPCCAVHAV